MSVHLRRQVTKKSQLHNILMNQNTGRRWKRNHGERIISEQNKIQRCRQYVELLPPTTTMRHSGTQYSGNGPDNGFTLSYLSCCRESGIGSCRCFLQGSQPVIWVRTDLEQVSHYILLIYSVNLLLLVKPFCSFNDTDG